jgi:PKD repeat protein
MIIAFRVMLLIIAAFSAFALISCTDDDGASTDSANQNRVPQGAFSANPANGAKGTEITFDASASQDPDGTIQLYQWDFGDGARGEGKIAKHRYDSSGNFTVVLTVTDDKQGKSTSTGEIRIENTIPPVAHFNFQPQQGDINTVFSFDGSASTDSDGRIKTHKWQFGDGTSAQGENVKHKFKNKGEHIVRLTVTDNDGLESMKEKDLRIIGRPPVASFSISPESGTIDTVFTFDSSASHDDGRIVEHRWLIENNTFTNRIPQYSFKRAGSHPIRLTVTDNDGVKDTISRILQVRGDEDPGPDPDPDGQNCSARTSGMTAWRAYVESYSSNPKSVVLRFVDNPGCDAFYRCGDVRYGGLPGWNNEKERWVGVMCEFKVLGGGRAYIRLSGHAGNYVPQRGDKVYTWPQWDCNNNRFCGGN